ncbi:DinB family protein [Chitinophagaceae bacterium MMS25-I14]
MKSENRAQIVAELTELIRKGNAHAPFEEAVADLPADLRTAIPGNLPYSIWQLTEHIRITQWDIVEFCISPRHKSPKWPDEYWPAENEHPDDHTWEKSLQQIKEDRNRFFELLKDEQNDLFAAFPYGTGQNLFREALLIADHTAYHTAEIIVLRRLLNSWK